MIRNKIGILTLAALAAMCLQAENPNRIKPLADDFVVVCKSPDPQRIYCFTPGICRLPSGRLVATCDLGGPGAKGPRGRIFVSDDHGKTWRKTGEFPLSHARPFLAGGKLYILGHSGDLGVLRSEDCGETWSETAKLTQGEKWHQSACNVWYAKGNVYLVMERRVPSPDGRNFGWAVNRIEPILMRAKETDDLTKRASWTFAESFCFDSIFGGNPDPELDYVGIPWYTAFTAYSTRTDKGWKVNVPKGVARSQPIGWLETNVVQFMDPNHVWYDPSGNTFHLFMRANTGGAGYAAMAKVVELPDGTMKTSLECAPSGRKMLFLPFPGGQMRFHVLWDEKTKLYWLPLPPRPPAGAALQPAVRRAAAHAAFLLAQHGGLVLRGPGGGGRDRAGVAALRVDGNRRRRSRGAVALGHAAGEVAAQRRHDHVPPHTRLPFARLLTPASQVEGLDADLSSQLAWNDGQLVIKLAVNAANRH